ncbi:hypothetical protein RJ639_035370, partial [Escallonia herrerae]
FSFFPGSSGPLKITELEVTVNANSSMDITANNFGYHDEPINGVERGGTPTEQELVNAGTYDTDGAYDTQQNVTPPAEEDVTHIVPRINDNDEEYDNQQNAISSAEEDVINVVGGGHHNELTDEACNTGGADDDEGETKCSPEEVNLSVVNGGCPDGQISGNMQLGDASVGHISVKPEGMKYGRRVQLFFIDGARVIFVNYNDFEIKKMEGLYEEPNNCGTRRFLVSILGAKPPKNIRGTNLWGQIVTQNLKVFTFTELRKATNNFGPDTVLGGGGTGMVFKGWVDEKTHAPSVVGVGMAVVVKKVNTNGSLGPKEAQLKEELLGKFSHPNLVKLIGYCVKDEDVLLVYELRIALGAAQGLAFLHKTREQAMYRAFKASDILLDENFSAKLSDFGLFKLGPTNSESVISTLVPGDTAFMDFPQKDVGYVDPEYVASGKLPYLVYVSTVARGFSDEGPSSYYQEGLLNTILSLTLGYSQEDSDLEDHVIRTDFNDRDSNPYTRFSFSGSSGSLTVTELEVSVNANSSIDISANNFGYHDEQINGLERGGTPTEQELVNASTNDTNQQNIIPPAEEDVTHVGRINDNDEDYDNHQDAISCAEEDVINVVGGGHHNELTDEACNTGEADDDEGETKCSPEEVNLNVVNSGCPDGQIIGNIQLGDASVGHISVKPEGIKYRRRVLLFFRDPTRVIFVATSTKDRTILALALSSIVVQYPLCNAIKLHVSLLGAKPPKNIRGTNLRGQIVTPNLKIFTFAELSRATNNFGPDMVLGRGGLGMVFKGWVDEKTYAPSVVGVGMAVVVKKVDTNGSLGLKEAQLKVKILGKFSHPNLVKLIGYCTEDEDVLLVYEYVKNGSLEGHLFKKDSEPLPWVTRLRIALGAAQGLAFLHKTREQAMYRTFKASDILLDENFSAKLSDFGLFKLGPMNSESVISTLVAGDTAFMDFPQKDVGYVDPEYMASGNLTLKSDIYGFGAVLLEILTGQRVLDMKRPSGKHDLVRYARPFLNGKRDIKIILDQRLEHEYAPEDEILSAVAALTLKCLEDYPKNRPGVKEVLETLEHVNAVHMEANGASSSSSSHPPIESQE